MLLLPQRVRARCSNHRELVQDTWKSEMLRNVWFWIPQTLSAGGNNCVFVGFAGGIFRTPTVGQKSLKNILSEDMWSSRLRSALVCVRTDKLDCFFFSFCLMSNSAWLIHWAHNIWWKYYFTEFVHKRWTFLWCVCGEYMTKSSSFWLYFPCVFFFAMMSYFRTKSGMFFKGFCSHHKPPFR